MPRVSKARAPASLVVRLAALSVAVTAIAAGGCDWFDDPVEANLPPYTWMDVCPSSEDVAAGEDVQLSWGGNDPDGSIDHYEWTLDDTLSGSSSDAELTIEGISEGAHVFTVAAVDAEGEADPTPAECTFSAVLGGHLVGRVVLAEMMTTKYCTNCPKAEQALDELIQEYGASELCVVAYHYDNGLQYQDPVATEESTARIEWYYENHDGGEDPEDDIGYFALQFPLVVFDGGRFVVGAHTVNEAKIDYRLEIDPRREIGSPLSLEVVGEIGATSGSVTVTATVEDALPSGDYVIRFAVIENGIVVGIDHFDFVPRLQPPDEPLTADEVGEVDVVTRTFAVDGSWNPDNMDIIAFVQNDETLEVIQAGRLGTRGSSETH